MRVTVHMDPIHTHHKEYGDLFVAGLAKHGIKAHVQRAFIPTDCNVAVIWGRHKRAQAVIDHQLKRGHDVIVLERGFFGDRLNDCTSVSLLDGGESVLWFNNQDSPSDRYDQNKDMMKPWKPGKKYVMVMGQHPNDVAVDSIDIREWVYDQLVALKKAGHKVMYRPNPVDKGRQKVPANTMVDYGALVDSLKDAKCVVTYNSTSGVDALLAGIPVIAMNEKSMVYSVAGHDLDYLKPKKIKEPEREQWAHNLAYCQWSKEELENGSAFAHIMGIQEDAKTQTDQVNQDR